jgi:hypothetical protein
MDNAVAATDIEVRCAHRHRARQVQMRTRRGSHGGVTGEMPLRGSGASSKGPIHVSQATATASEAAATAALLLLLLLLWHR